METGEFQLTLLNMDHRLRPKYSVILSQIQNGWNKNSREWEAWQRRDFRNKFFTCPLTTHVLHASMHNRINFQSFICWFSLQFQAFPVLYTENGGIASRASVISMQRTSCTQSTRCTYIERVIMFAYPIQIMHIYQSHSLPIFEVRTHTHTAPLAWKPGRHTMPIQFYLLISLIHLVSEISASVRRKMRARSRDKETISHFTPHVLCSTVGCMNVKNTSHSKQFRKQILRRIRRRQHDHMLRSTPSFPSYIYSIGILCLITFH